LCSIVGQVLGVKAVPIEYRAAGKRRSISIPTLAAAEIEALRGQGDAEVTIANHPVAVASGFPAVVAKSKHASYRDHTFNWELAARTVSTRASSTKRKREASRRSTASADFKDRTRDIRRRAGEQPQDGLRDFDWRSRPLHRNSGRESFKTVGRAGLGVQISCDNPGGHDIDPDSLGRYFAS